MTLTIITLIISLALVVLGADKLVDGASSIAKKIGISDFVIGLTIVGFGTSCPELVVSVTGALEGLSDVAVGNVIGSNIFNALLILGLTAVLSPIAITPQNRKMDIPVTIVVTVLLCALIVYGSISRVSGLIFLLLFAGYIALCFKSGQIPEESNDKHMGTGAAIFWTLLGLAALIAGGKFFVDSSVSIARSIGVSEKFIAITLLAGGTSLPELVTCIIASAKHKDQLALGNILGSNVFNILLILGTSSVIRPIDCGAISFVDTGVLLLSSVIILTSAFTGRNNKIGRVDGAIMLAMEAAYFVYLVIYG